MKKDIDKLIDELIEFREKNDWKKFHNAKDLALAISVESAELLENFLWRDSTDEFNKKEVAMEMADIFIYLIYMADSIDIDLLEVAEEKLKINKERFKDGWENKK